MTNFDKVGIFMKTFGQEVKDKPSLSDEKINQLRLSLIKEELDELKEAMNNKELEDLDLSKIDKELGFKGLNEKDCCGN